MNELKIEFSNESFLYYKTKEKTASDALTDFENICDHMGINLDNMIITEVVLRDEDYNDIDRMKI